MSKTISKTILNNTASNIGNNIYLYCNQNIALYCTAYCVHLVNIVFEIAQNIDRNWLAHCLIYGEMVYIEQIERVSIYCAHFTKLYKIVSNYPTYVSIYQYCSIVRNCSTHASIVQHMPELFGPA